MEKDFQFIRPRFREGVSVIEQESSTVLHYRKQSCDLEFDQSNKDQIGKLLHFLKDGQSDLNTFILKSSWECEQVQSVIEEFDRLGLLIEVNTPSLGECISGLQLYQAVVGTYEKVTNQLSKSSFYTLLSEGEATRSQLLGYAMEYYHLTKLAPGIIGPLLAKAESRKTQRILQDFLRSELYHDKMLEKALAAEGIDISDIDLVQPLPSTFTICSSLGVYAQQHPLSLKSALFIFEKPSPEFNAAFSECCVALNMPKEFYAPILRHAEINDEGDHGSISEMLLTEVQALSNEERNTVLKHIILLCETLIKQEHDIINYYKEDNIQLRKYN